MNIGFFADGPWSHESIKKILNDKKFKIKFIVARYKNPDLVLKKFADLNKIDFYIFKDINSKKTLNLLSSYNADLHVSMSFNQIIKKDLMRTSPKGFINCHAGALPFYRGRNILNWVLINGEKEFGVTVHYIDEGIDTGDIILQKKYSISKKDDYRSLLNRSYIYCSNLLLESLNLIYFDKVERINQKSIDPIGSYCRRRVSGDELINWNSNSESIFNFIRGITSPGPGARSFFKNKEIIILGSKMLEDNYKKNKIPGTIIDKFDNKLVVQTKNSILLINKYFIVKKDTPIEIGDKLE